MSLEIKGKYFGTEIDEKWWKRYTKEKMLARGNGTFSYDGNSISFLRLLTRVPIKIRFADIQGFKTGKWHSGQWGGGRRIIKVLWKKNGQLLSSGFAIAKENAGTDETIAELNLILEEAKQ